MMKGKMKGPMGPPPAKGTLGRAIKLFAKAYPVLFPVSVFCIVFSAVTASLPAIFTQRVIAVIEKWYITKNWDAASQEIFPLIGLLIGLYVVSMICATAQSQLMAYMTQGFLSKMRRKMFDGMQNLPLAFFDRRKHGDIMSHYTNDIDTLRQLISQSLPSLLQAGIVISCVFGIMLYYSIWMTAIVLAGIIIMSLVTRKIGGGSAKYFVRQQRSMAVAEGYIQEMMNGQKVVKVFCREKRGTEDFEKINESLFNDAFRANAYANILAPIIMNLGNIMYVIIAICGGLFLLTGATNVSLSGMAFEISIVVPFLNMTKQFTGNINTFSQQINHIAMGMAGASRIFSLMDEKAETDDGKVTLVNAVVDGDGNITETE